MALTRCKDCNKDVSLEADSCPHCGAPRKPKQPRFSSYIVAIALFVVLIFFLGLIGNSSTSSYSSSTHTAAQPDVVELGKDCMRSIGLDPSDSSATVTYEDTIAVGNCLDKKLGR